MKFADRTHAAFRYDEQAKLRTGSHRLLRESRASFCEKGSISESLNVEPAGMKTMVCQAVETGFRVYSHFAGSFALLQKNQKEVCDSRFWGSFSVAASAGP